MSFYDVRRISYDRFVQRAATDNPYKGSGNAYPLGERRYSDRHFRREDDGTFTIWYADREMVDNKFGRINDKADTYGKDQDEYYARRMIGRVHPDNSFEFTAGTAQGENMLLSRGLNGHLHHDVSKGGTVFKRDRFSHPVFKGLRINCDTGEAMTPYTVFLPTLKRKEAHNVMSGYQEFIRVFQTMINSMDDLGIWGVLEDLYKIEAQGDRELWRNLDMSVVKRLIAEKKYVDAGCLFAMLSRGSHIRWRVEWYIQNGSQPNSQNLGFGWRNTALNSIARDFRRKVLKQHPEVFALAELKQGDPLPSSQWGVRVEVNGQSVIRL